MTCSRWRRCPGDKVSSLTRLLAFLKRHRPSSLTRGPTRRRKPPSSSMQTTSGSLTAAPLELLLLGCCRPLGMLSHPLSLPLRETQACVSNHLQPIVARIPRGRITQLSDLFATRTLSESRSWRRSRICHHHEALETARSSSVESPRIPDIFRLAIQFPGATRRGLGGCARGSKIGVSGASAR